jgi:hypothetical protein
MAPDHLSLRPIEWFKCNRGGRLGPAIVADQRPCASRRAQAWRAKGQVGGPAEEGLSYLLPGLREGWGRSPNSNFFYFGIFGIVSRRVV